MFVVQLQVFEDFVLERCPSLGKIIESGGPRFRLFQAPFLSPKVGKQIPFPSRLSILVFEGETTQIPDDCQIRLYLIDAGGSPYA